MKKPKLYTVTFWVGGKGKPYRVRCEGFAAAELLFDILQAANCRVQLN